MSNIFQINQRETELTPRQLVGPWGWARLLSGSILSSWGFTKTDRNDAPPGACIAYKFKELFIWGPAIVELGQPAEPFPGACGQGSRITAQLLKPVTVGAGGDVVFGPVDVRDADSLLIIATNQDIAHTRDLRFQIVEPDAGEVTTIATAVVPMGPVKKSYGWGSHGAGNVNGLLEVLPAAVPQYVQFTLVSGGGSNSGTLDVYGR